MKGGQFFLFPFAVLYDAVTRFRNHLYNISYKKSFQFEANVISVGNLSVGGTGKTPMVSYLVNHFIQQGKKVATLSRGYGRKTKGFRICNSGDSPSTVGDEPFTYFEQYGDKVMVAVGEERALAIPFILAEQPDTDVILLDDAFQHRTVKPSFSILLTTSHRPFWKDYLLPAGRLRESRMGVKRTDAIVVTKAEKVETPKELSVYKKPFFYSGVVYDKPVYFYGSPEPIKRAVVVVGLAKNMPFVEYAKTHFHVIHTFEFRDHYHYTNKEVSEIAMLLNDATLITTHKDAVKLRQFKHLKEFNCAYIPIKVKFLEQEERFLQMVDESFKHYSINP